MKKSIKYLIISLLIIFVLLAGIIAIFFLEKNLLVKSNKQVFFQYLSQEIVEVANYFKDDDLEKYIEKQKNTPYSNEGEIKVECSSDELNSGKETKILKDTNISFNGETDFANKNMIQKITLNYPKKEKMEFDFFGQEDFYGIKIINVLGKYLTVENNNLKQWAKKMGNLDEQILDQIPDKIDISNLKNDSFSEEEIKTLKNKYFNVILNDLEEDLFTKNEENKDLFSENTDSQGTQYTLKISQRKVNDILIDIVENIKEDELILQKIVDIYKKENPNISENDINEYIESFKTDVDEYITYLNKGNADIDSTFNTVTIYLLDDKITKVDINLANDKNKLTIYKEEGKYQIEYHGQFGYYKVNISKSKQDDILMYKIELNSDEYDETNVTLDIGFKGIQTLSQVQEKAMVTYKGEDILDISEGRDNDLITTATYTNTTIFKPGMQIPKIDKNEMYVLNGKSLEELLDIGTKTLERLNDLNNEQMQKIGLEMNPIYNYYSGAIIPTTAIFALQQGKDFINPIIERYSVAVFNIYMLSLNY